MAKQEMSCKECGNPHPEDANYCPYCGTPLYQRQPIPPKVRYFVLNRDNHTCQYCGRTPQDGIKLHVDHRIPVSRGGTNDPENLVTACDECNLGKGKSLPGQNPYVALRAAREKADRAKNRQSLIEKEYQNLKAVIAPELDSKFWFCRAALHNSGWAWRDGWAGQGLKDLRDTEKIFAQDLKDAAERFSGTSYFSTGAFTVGVILADILADLANQYWNALEMFQLETPTDEKSIALKQLRDEVSAEMSVSHGLLDVDDDKFFRSARSLEEFLDGENEFEEWPDWIESLNFDGLLHEYVENKLWAAKGLLRLRRDVSEGAHSLQMNVSQDSGRYEISVPEYMDTYYISGILGPELSDALKSILHWTYEIGDAESFFHAIPELDTLRKKTRTGRNAVESIEAHLKFEPESIRLTPLR